MSNDAPAPAAPAARLVVVLSSATRQRPGPALLALRYASTASALDVPAELHVVSPESIHLFEAAAPDADVAAALRQAREHGVDVFACPAALAEAGLRSDALVDGFAGVRGAASLLSAGLGSDARFLNF